MKNLAFQIPLNDMEPPYPDMDGAKIRIVTSGGIAIGDVVTSHDRPGHRFGIRIDVQRPVSYHPARPIPLGQWVEIGTITVDTIKLSKEQIQRITKTADSNTPFELRL